MKRPKSYAGQVYFLRPIGMSGPVKIGYTILGDHRFREISACSPLPLEVAAKVECHPDTERLFHARFLKFRTHGEWFSPSECLLRTIAEINAGTFDFRFLNAPDGWRLPRGLRHATEIFI